jgi:hypothetical protein
MEMELNRRRFLGGTAAFALISPATAKDEEVYRLRTADAEIEMTIEFLDGYASRGFWFGEHISNRRYCLSADGQEGRNCVAAFRGSLAIARYRVRPRSHPAEEPVLREYVRTIDRDARLPDRPPFERSIVLKKGIGSDLQAFGYESAPKYEPLFDQNGPWYLYRQDLFLEPQRVPFLVVYWKHSLASIRVLDLIPGDQTWVEKK